MNLKELKRASAIERLQAIDALRRMGYSLYEITDKQVNQWLKEHPIRGGK